MPRADWSGGVALAAFDAGSEEGAAAERELVDAARGGRSEAYEVRRGQATGYAHGYVDATGKRVPGGDVAGFGVAYADACEDPRVRGSLDLKSAFMSWCASGGRSLTCTPAGEVLAEQ
jgi:hypothetical protein